MNTYEKAELGAELYLDAESSMEACFVYYAVDVLGGESEPVDAIWTDCVQGTQAKLASLRAKTLKRDTEQAFLKKKALGAYARNKWRFIKAGIVAYHLEQSPPREFVVPSKVLSEEAQALKDAKLAAQSPEDKAEAEAKKKQAELKKARADAIRTLGDGIATDIKTLRNLALTANKADDAETLKTMRAKLVKLHRAVVKELPAE